MRSPHTAMKSSPRSPQLEKAHAQQRRPNAAKNKINNKSKYIKKKLKAFSFNLILNNIYSLYSDYTRNAHSLQRIQKMQRYDVMKNIKNYQYRCISYNVQYMYGIYRTQTYRIQMIINISVHFCFISFQCVFMLYKIVIRLFISLTIFVNLFYLFIFGCVGSSLLRTGFLQLWFAGFTLWWLLLLQSTGSRHMDFSSCGARAQQLWLVGSRAQTQQLWLTGLVSPWHV